MEIFFIVLFGLVTGSFLGAVTWRIPRGKGFVKGRSVCDNCKSDLPWFVNIPVFSYIFLRGRSYCCNKKISIRYPLIEISSLMGFIALYLKFGINFNFFVYATLFLLTLAVFIIDFEHQYIPDEISFLILILSVLILPHPPFENLLAGFLSSLFLLLIYLITKGKGMGLGDVKLALGLGIILGLYKSLIWMSASFLTGGLIASILLLLGKAGLKQKIAFGPFLIIGFWITVFL